jgi:hypothetical protein
MFPAPLRKAGYTVVAAYGLFAALAPRLASRLGVRMGLPGFSNTSKLEAEDWYVRAVRATGVGMLAAGGTGLLLEERATKEDAEADADVDIEIDTDEDEPEEEGSDDPVDIDV